MATEAEKLAAEQLAAYEDRKKLDELMRKFYSFWPSEKRTAKRGVAKQEPSE